MPHKAHGNDLVEIAGLVAGETEKAFRFDSGTGETVWLPKSLFEWDETEKIMTMPEWLAMEKGLI